MKKLIFALAIAPFILLNILVSPSQAGSRDKNWIIDFYERDDGMSTEEVKILLPSEVMGLVWVGHECDREEMLSRVNERMERYNASFTRRALSRLESAVGECSDETTEQERDDCICSWRRKDATCLLLNFQADPKDIPELDGCDRAAESLFQTILIVVNDHLDRHPELNSGAFWTCLADNHYNGFDESVFNYCHCLAEAETDIKVLQCLGKRATEILLNMRQEPAKAIRERG